MKLLVCVKAVPAQLQAEGQDGTDLHRDQLSLQWNIADESALEAALQLRGNGRVTVLTMGPEKLRPALRELLSRGADRAVLLSDPAMAGSDTCATARALVAAVRHMGGFDLILCGRRAMDGETGQTPAMLAAELGLPCVTEAEQIQREDDGRLRVLRRLESGRQTLYVQTPAVVTLCEYSYRLRLPGLFYLRSGQAAQVEQMNAAELGLSPSQCGLAGSLTRVSGSTAQMPGLRACRREENAQDGAALLLRLCMEVLP